MAVTLNEPVPDLPLNLTGGRHLNLPDLRGRALVLYFYPKASTPGCTQEGQAFRDAYGDFQAAGADILGASRDGLKAQEGFKAKQGFPFELVADTDEALCQAFDVIRLKNLYGKQVRGIERSTFLIDAAGILRRDWRKVSLKGHVAAVLAAVRSLASG